MTDAARSLPVTQLPENRWLLDGARVIDTDWQRRSACDPDDQCFFHPEDAGTAERRRLVAEAKKICATCPVTQECLAFALSNEIDDGVWGGLTRVERKKLLRFTAEPAPFSTVPIPRGDCDG